MKQIKPVAARKTIRLEYGSGPQILSVKEKKIIVRDVT